MAEKTIRTRIKLLYKSYSDWQSIKDTFIPLAGELCIVAIPANTGAVVQEPAFLFKIGDGVKTFSELGYSSALAADVYNWAKKASLDWEDLDATFKAELEEFIASHAPTQDTQYRIVDNGVDKWKLQKSTDGTTWVDAEGSIDIAKKVDKLIESAEGRAYIFNEADGGGAKFEHVDGTDSFTGVNNGGKDGIAGQIYAIDRTTKKGSKLDITTKGMFYTTGDESGKSAAQRDIEDNELVTKKDIKDLEKALKYVGKTTLAAGETVEQAIERLLQEKGIVAKAGFVVIIETGIAAKEFIYDGDAWEEFGDVSLYATKAQLDEETIARVAADEDLAQDIEARKLEILPVSAYGFDTNLRVNQQVNGSALVDKVIELTNVDKKQAVIKSGDYKYNIVSIVNDETLGIKGFAIETMNLSSMTSLDAEPIIEKGVFLYNPELGKTCSFYGTQYTNGQLDYMVAQLQAALATKLDETDTLILDCNQAI